MSQTPLVLVLLLAIGALGLYLAMPGARRDLSRLALLVLAAAAGMFIGWFSGSRLGPAPLWWFLGAAVVACYAAVRVVTHRRPVYSALYFVLLLVAVTVLLVLMQAEFLAAALAIVYAGAILVTYVFVIMLAQQARPPAYDAEAREPLVGCCAGFVLVTLITAQLFGTPPAPPVAPATTVPQLTGTVEAVGTRLLTEYVVGVQMAGLLLLAALVGAIAIARRRRASPPEGEGGSR
jgi:NADH-quinone oxidoreductase subunit J